MRRNLCKLEVLRRIWRMRDFPRRICGVSVAYLGITGSWDVKLRVAWRMCSVSVAYSMLLHRWHGVSFLPATLLLRKNGVYNIGIKHGFSCINIYLVPREVLKTEAGGRRFQHLPRGLANVNALKNHVLSLLLHKD